MRNILGLPVLRVYAWSSRASENPLGAEYIFMEKQAGVVLTDVWDTIKGKQKAGPGGWHGKAPRDHTILEIRVPILKDDLAGNCHPASPLHSDSDGNEVRNRTFGIEPTNHRSFFGFGRGALNIERGPCKFISDLYDIIIILRLPLPNLQGQRPPNSWWVLRGRRLQLQKQVSDTP